MAISRRSPGAPKGPPEEPPPLLELLLRPRVAIAAALVSVAVLCWLYLFAEAAEMPAMGDLTMVMPPKGAVDLVLLLVMWWIMMIGMMLPTRADDPDLRHDERGRSAHATLGADGPVHGRLLPRVGGFTIAATLAQWGLESVAWSRHGHDVTSPLLGGLLFIAAGLYQFTPLKDACLVACRSPFDFVVNRWRDGALGALRMGAAHGLYCLGCCWILMALLFVVGAMNLVGSPCSLRPCWSRSCCRSACGRPKSADWS